MASSSSTPKSSLIHLSHLWHTSEEWEHYNKLDFVYIKSDTTQAKSYTQYFTEKYHFKSHMEHEKIIQLGASGGSYLEELKKEGYEVKAAYELSAEGIRQLKSRHIPFRHVNLNKIAETELEYAKELKEDLAEPINLFLIRILTYLTPEAQRLLLLTLIIHAQPGSTFFIVNSIITNIAEVEKRITELPSELQRQAEEAITPLKPLHFLSFFHSRSNFTTLKCLRSTEWKSEIELPISENKNIKGSLLFCDEILVVRKMTLSESTPERGLDSESKKALNT